MLPIYIIFIFIYNLNKIHNVVNQVSPKIDDYDSRDLTWDHMTPGGIFSVTLSYLPHLAYLASVR